MARDVPAAVSVRSPVQLEEIRRLMRVGRYLQAYQITKQTGSLERWAGAEAQCLAGRLATHLGAPRLGRRMHLRAFRRSPANTEAFLHYARVVLTLRGPWEAWGVLRQTPELRTKSAELTSDLLALRGRIAGQLRDFETAESWLTQAEALTPNNPWLSVERAVLLEEQDRYDEGLAAARQALGKHPCSAPLNQITARLLQLSGRPEEAVTLLQQAMVELESGAIAGQLAILQIELGRHASALEILNRFAELNPLLESEGVQWLTVQRADAAYLAGNLAQAAEHARHSSSSFYQTFAQRCAGHAVAPANVRRLLPVSFVRQHHMTCAPATLAALSNFWGKPVDHAAVADRICYNGTYSHAQRRWAEENGFVAREFRVTRECALALIDRGIPFALSTMEATSGHLQALVGYDLLRETFIIRDPTLPNVCEFHITPFLERYRFTGPRAMALVPVEQAELFHDIELPEADLYNLTHTLDYALAKNDRPRAEESLAKLRTEAPGHRLTLAAQQTLAGYDGRWPEILESVEQQLELFPGENRLQLIKLAGLRQLAPRGERLAWLKTVCEGKKADCSLWIEYASELCADARDHTTAKRWLKRVGRFQREGPAELSLRAGLHWNRNETSIAAELYRFAACLDDKDESQAATYFNVACAVGQNEAALRFLLDRFERFGHKAHYPTTTLFWAYCQLHQAPAAFAKLEQALQQRPEDSELLLFATEAFARHGKLERSAELLAAAKDKTSPTRWQRGAADLELYRGDRSAALDLWKAVLAVEPLALDAHRRVAGLLAETEGRAAAVRHLEETCKLFPHHFGLHQLSSEFLQEEGPAAREKAARKLLAINPVSIVSHRELASSLAAQKRHDEALATLDQALQLDPENSDLVNQRAWLLRGADRGREAREEFRKAVRLSIDQISSIKGLIELSSAPMARAEATAFIKASLVERRISGDALLSFRVAARSLFEPAELLAILTTVLENRLDSWQAWSAVINQLADLRQNEPALEKARAAIERFPQVATLRLDLARVQGAHGDQQAEIEALQQARRLDPSSLHAVRQLAQAYECCDRLPEAKAILEEAIASAPTEAVNHGCLASMLWKLGEKPAALECAKKAALADLNYRWAWQALRNWGQEMGQPRLDLVRAREFTSKRPGHARVWLLLVDLLDQPEQQTERRAAVGRALECDARSVEAHDWNAILLAHAARYDDAAAAARPAVFQDQLPPLLELRAARIEVQRGNGIEGIKRMRGFLQEHPDYFDGWAELADWLMSAGDYDGALEAGTTMARLEPVQSYPELVLARLELAANHRDSAKQHFQRTLRLDPNCDEAACQLFKLQLADREAKAARATLDQMRRRGVSPQVAVCEIMFAVDANDPSTAMGWFRELSNVPGADHGTLDTATDVIMKAGLTAAAEGVLHEAMRVENSNPRAGLVWTKLRMSCGRYDCLKELNRLHQRGEQGRQALLIYIERLGIGGNECLHKGERSQMRRCRKLLKRVIRRHRNWLCKDAAGWGSVGIALTSLRETKAALAWMADWKQQSDLCPTVLNELVFALQSSGRTAEAAEVCRHAVQSVRRDDATPMLELWLALEEVLAGDAIAAEKRLAPLCAEQFEAFYQKVFELTQALIEAELAAPKDRDKVFQRVFADLKSRFPSDFVKRSDQALRRAFRRTVRHLASSSGNWRLKLWSYRRLYCP